MATRFHSDEDDEIDEDDPVPALLASLLLVMSCAKCNGSGEVKNQRCECRDVAYEVATTTLRAEGLVR